MRKLQTKNINCCIQDFDVRSDVPICDKVDKKEVVKHLYKILTDVTVMYFGVHQSQIQDVVLNKVIKNILTNYSTLRLSEVMYSFERCQLERKVTCIVDDYMKPITAFYNVIKNKNICISELTEEQREEQRNKEEKTKFKADSINLYNECLKTGNWTGTIWNASALKDLLKIHFDYDLRKEMYQQAIAEAEMLPDFNELSFEDYHKFMGLNKDTIYADKLVKLSIKNKIHI